jgi:hypothetical protein
MRSAPSSRRTQPFNMGLVAMWPTSAGSERLLHGRWHVEQQRCPEEAGCYSDYTDSQGCQLSGGGHGERGDPTFRGGIGGLPDLALEGGNGGRVDDHPALAVGQWLEARHGGRHKAQHVEGADQIDAYHPREVVERHRPPPANDARRRGDAGTVDEEADVASPLNGSLSRGIGDV